MIAGLDITEKQWQAQIVELARMLGWQRIYHTFDSRRSQPGFPDLFMLRERAIAVELKTEAGKLSDPQRGWISALLDAGVETYVARPSDLEDLAKILGSRGDPFVKRGPIRDAATRLHARAHQEVPVPAD